MTGKKKRKKKHTQWWNEEVKGKVKLKKEAWNKFVSTYRKTDMSII
jgi:hypothetical protein